MLMPDKHITFSKSILGFGSYLLTNLSSPKSVDALWRKYQKDFEADLYPARFSFDNFLLTVVFLFSIGAVYESEEGVLSRCA